FPVGLALIGCYGLAAGINAVWQRGRAAIRDGRVWSLAACLAVSIGATCLNPYGWRVVQYVGLTSSAATARHIDEWLAPGLDQLVGVILVASVVLLFVLFALPSARPRVREVCLIACFLPFAVGSARMIAWWLLVTAPIIARLLAANLPARLLREEKPEK